MVFAKVGVDFVDDLYMCASKRLILISRIMQPKEINVILDGALEKTRFFDCILFCDGDIQKLPPSTYINMAILQILSTKPSLYDEWFASYDVLREF